MAELDYKQLAKKLFSLYVMTTKKYLLQNVNSYTTVYFPLNDYTLMNHLKGGRTVGILLGEAGLTKFLCFDVDIKNKPEKAQEITRRLVMLLMVEYGIEEKDIHVSESGGKGYHVELFFDKATPYKTFEPFYYEVLDKLGENIHSIEQRPTSKGVKIPLGVHRGTSKTCWYVNPHNLKPIKKKDYILAIEPMDFEDFKAKILDKVEEISVRKKPTFVMTHKQGEQTENVLNDVNLNDKSLEEIESEIIKVIHANRLLYSGTRHKMTLQIAKYFYSQGEDSEVAFQVLVEIMKNTWKNHRDFISETTSKVEMLQDIERTVNDVYSKGYLLNGGKTEIEISKGEILKILEVKEWHLKTLLLSLLIHSKKFKKKDNSFSMSYSIMTKYGNTTKRSRLLKYLKMLEEMGKIKIIARAVPDEARSKAEKMFLYKPNVYEVTLLPDIDEDEKATITLKSDTKADLIEIVPKLITKIEIKKILPKSQIYNSGLKEAYN